MVPQPAGRAGAAKRHSDSFFPFLFSFFGSRRSLYHHGINGILADEMGLGKTLQTISFLGYLKHMCNKPGFHLVVVPKSTLDNWKREFTKWIPGFKAIVLTGDKDERREVLRDYVIPEKFDVLITTYEMCLKEKGSLLRISWEYIVIDEAHRIKNANSMLSQIVRAFDSHGRLLITGTPLQNNLMELWSLLNFLLPDVFSDASDFENWFAGKTAEKDGEDSEAKAEEQDAIVKQLHKVLRPFLLRRVKADVEKSLLPKKEINLFIGLTEMQRTWYKALLKKDVDAITGINARKEGKSRLQNIVMQLRKCCNHPYLFEGAEPEGMDDEQHLIDNAGKMVILDKLLWRMKRAGSRVLIFSQMGRMLDILSDYCAFRDYEYSRIDGSTSHEERIAAIDEFNTPGSQKFIFLLTTRAGGLGINLTTADVVVLYDSDWNPQADLQAMDRAHRIGQTKQVYVFRFVATHTVEERVLERATQKLRLDQLVIQQGRHQEKQKAQQNKEDLVDAIKHGADKILSGEGGLLLDANIEDIIADGERRTAELQARYQDVGIDALNSIQMGERPEWDNAETTAEGAADEEALNKLWLEPTKRERRTNYSEYYSNNDLASKTKAMTAKMPKPPKQVPTAFYQFFPLRLLALQRREVAAFHRNLGFRVPRREPEKGESYEKVEAERAKNQAQIDNAVELTEEEVAEKDALTQQGFTTWQKSDFWNFVRASEKHGSRAYAAIAEELSGHRQKRTEDEVRRYVEEFWSRGPTEVPDWDKISARIKEGEAKVAKAIHDEQLLRNKMKQYSDPLRQIKLTYGSNKGQRYALDQDRWLLIQLAEFGLQNPEVFERIHQAIRSSPLLRFDFWMKSRTVQEIARRCHKLIPIFLRDETGRTSGSGRKVKGKRRADADADSADEATTETAPEPADEPADEPAASTAGRTKSSSAPAAKKRKKLGA